MALPAIIAWTGIMALSAIIVRAVIMALPAIIAWTGIMALNVIMVLLSSMLRSARYDLVGAEASVFV